MKQKMKTKKNDDVKILDINEIDLHCSLLLQGNCM